MTLIRKQTHQALFTLTPSPPPVPHHLVTNVNQLTFLRYHRTESAWLESFRVSRYVNTLLPIGLRNFVFLETKLNTNFWLCNIHLGMSLWLFFHFVLSLNMFLWETLSLLARISLSYTISTCLHTKSWYETMYLLRSYCAHLNKTPSEMPCCVCGGEYCV